MKLRKNILFLCIMMFVMIPDMAARNQKKGQMRWSSHTNGLGLYGRNLDPTRHTIAFTIAPTYYAGDVELPGNPLNGYKDRFKDPTYQPVPGKNSCFNNVGAVGAIYYTYKQNSYISYRAQFMAGYLQGYCDFYRSGKDSKGNAVVWEYERKMSSFMMEYSLGIEVYPIPHVGLYLYTGVAGVSSYIHRDFNPYLANVNPILNENDRIWSTVPVIPVGLGYKHTFNRFVLGVEIMWHPALIDNAGANMDGWESGSKRNGYQYYPTKKESNKWNDSFTHLGITFAYTIPVGG